MDAVGVETFANCLRLLHEVGHILVRNDNVGRGDGLLLVKPPDMQFVHRLDPRDLGARQSVGCGGRVSGFPSCIAKRESYLFYIVLDVADIDAAGSALEQDQPAILDQRKRGEGS